LGWKCGRWWCRWGGCKNKDICRHYRKTEMQGEKHNKLITIRNELFIYY